MALRYVAVGALVIVAGVIAAVPASADSINLLRPATKTLSPSIMIDTIKRASADDPASASLDQDCVVIDDRTRNSAARRNSNRFNFSQLAWSQDETEDLSVIYILCVDPKEEPSAFDGGSGGGSMTAAWSWPGAPPRSREDVGATAGTLASTSDRPILTAAPTASPATTTNDLATGSSDTAPTHTSPASAFQFAEIDLLAADALSDFLASGTSESSAGSTGGFGGSADPGFGNASSGGGFGGGNEDLVVAPFDPLIVLDPQEMAPVPEPGTWLLLATGLAAAWRARRHK